MARHQHVHEGTPRELAPYLAQHPNRRFRLIDLTSQDEELTEQEAQKARERKTLKGMGAFQGKLGSTEALFQEKQEEIRREESSL